MLFATRIPRYDDGTPRLLTWLHLQRERRNLGRMLQVRRILLVIQLAKGVRKHLWEVWKSTYPLTLSVVQAILQFVMLCDGCIELAPQVYVCLLAFGDLALEVPVELLQLQSAETRLNGVT